MKRLLQPLFLVGLLFALAACGTANEEDQTTGSGDTEDTNEPVTLIVGAPSVPHGEILEEAKPLLEEEGIDLEIVPFQDFIMPNKALADEEIDANYFQHIPYLNAQIAEHNYEFTNAGGIHIEPIGIYSQKYDSLDELPEGALIIMSSSIPDHGRILMMLQDQGLITLKDDLADPTTATIEDIAENPKKLEFKTDVEAALLPQVYNNGEGDAVLINTNYAIDADLNPLEDAIALEGPESPYVNVIAVRTGDENLEEIKALVNALRSEQIQNFIKEKYEGAIVPVSE